MGGAAFFFGKVVEIGTLKTRVATYSLRCIGEKR